MSKNSEHFLHLGADLDMDFVEQFREFCKKAHFSQMAILKHLVEWWLLQEPEIQEHIYRGRFKRIKIAEDRRDPESEEEIQEQLVVLLKRIESLLKVGPKPSRSTPKTRKPRKKKS